VPAAHEVHPVELAAAKEPASQLLHVVDDDDAEYLPAAQLVH